MLSRILLLALITGVLAVLPAGPGQALYPGVTIDDFGGTRLGTPIIAYSGGATGSISGGTLNLQLGGDLPNSATATWVMPSPQDFTVGGKATNLRLDYTVATTTNSNPGAVVATMGATLTDASSRISTAYFSIPRGGTVNSIPFKQSGTGFPDTVDLTRITSLQITFFPGQTVGGGTLAHNLSIDRIWTMNLDTSIPQNISFTTTAPSTAGVGGAYIVSATGGGSGNPVTFSVGSGTTNNACTVSGSTVTFRNQGTCVVAADQLAGYQTINGMFYEIYAVAPTVTQTIAVTAKTNQTIAFISPVPGGASVGGTTTVAAGGGASGNPVTFSVGSATTNGACTVSGSTVTYRHVGTCAIAANQAGNASYNPAPEVVQTFAIGQGSQTLAFTSTAPSPGARGVPYLPTVSGGASGQPIVLSVSPLSTTDACTINAGSVSFDRPGTCVIAANQGGNADYTAAAQITQTITVAKYSQAISFTTTPPSSPTVESPDYAVGATGGGSGNAVRFGIGAGTTNNACSLTSSGTVSFDHAGTCIVTADQDGDASYAAATSASQTITVGKAAQTITFGAGWPTTVDLSAGAYLPSASGGGSGNAVRFDIGAGTTNNACSLARSGAVSFDNAGICVVTADQDGDDDHLPAPQDTRTITVTRIAQPLAFTSTAPTSPAVGATPYGVAASGGASGQPVRFGIGAGTTNNACSISGSTVSFAHAGTCVITADQDGDARYAPATRATQTISVVKATQSVSFVSSVPADPRVGGTYLATTTGGNSGNAVRLGIGAGTTKSACSLTPTGSISLDHAGVCVLTADQDGTDDYLPAPQATQQFTVAKVGQVISFLSSPPTTALVGGSYTVSAQTGLGTTVVLGIGAGTTNNACTLSGSTVTFAHAGTCVVTADQGGDDDREAATQATQSFSVGQAAQSVAFTSTAPTAPAVGATPYLVTATGGASG
ncbi:hypothetical protein, partial [Nocardioides fonticola]|uniref:beta strand repeat-containing protein n=1 Tax=Nocardioides fonticola TaxID=450363 RepID=UPI0031DA02A2